jgi:superfamily I DNA/RNA helicase
MALMMGPLRPNHTKGEEIVFDALRRYLSNEYQVWPELPVQGDAERQHPDFVLLHPMWGIIVLEVKDYVQILSADPYGITFRRRDGTEGSEKNPLNQAKGYCDTIGDMIEDTYGRARSEGSFHGPLPNVCRASGVVLTWQTAVDIVWLEQRLRAKGYLLGKDDLTKLALEGCLKSLHRPGGVECLDQAGLDLVRRALFPEGDMYDRNGEYIGHLDPQQEIGVKEGIFLETGTEEEPETEEDASGQIDFLSDFSPMPVALAVDKLELTGQGEELVPRFSIRLVRGVAGSGKTQILCKRAVLLAKLHPDWNILVLTRNKGLAADLEEILRPYETIEVSHSDRLCRGILSDPEVDLWRSPVKDQDQPNWIASVCREVYGAEEFDPRFLRDEFNWMKYIARTDREAYIAEDRVGREIPLDRKTQRPIVYRVFEEYENRLKRFRQMVWADVPLLMIEAIDTGLMSVEQYDAILVDEAQMFPPTWFEVVKRWLKPPHGTLFLAADMIQNIYSRFSWEQKGVKVRGRSRILRRTYRNSYYIARAAHHLVSNDADLQTLLKKDGDELIEPELDPKAMERGHRPKLVSCSSLDVELKYMTDQVKALIQDPAHPVWPSEIAILCLKDHTQKTLASHLGRQGVRVVLDSDLRNTADGPRVLVGLIAGITGQEFRSVFVCDLQDLFDSDSPYYGGSWPEFKARQLRLLYTAMTRARKDLHLCFRQKLHSALRPLREVTASVRI